MAHKKLKKVIQIRVTDYTDVESEEVYISWNDTCWSSIKAARAAYPGEEYRIIYV